MSPEIIVAIISAIATISGVVITVNSNNKKMETQIVMTQAITNTNLENLKAEVQKHNNFASRMPVVEEQIKIVNHRLDDTNSRIDATNRRIDSFEDK
jgi:peptidoglycan hydrolase CwlO-like protein